MLSDVAVDTEICAYERIVTGPMHASTFTCTFSAVIDAFDASRSFFPNGIVVIVPGAIVD